MTFPHSSRFLFILLALLGLGSITPTQGQTLTLEATATTFHDYVTLGEVARISNCEPSLRQGLGSIFLGPAPGTFHREQILVRLEQSGVQTQSIEFQGSQTVRVTRSKGDGLDSSTPRSSQRLSQTAEHKKPIPGDPGLVPARAVNVRRDRSNLERGDQVAPDTLWKFQTVVARRNLPRGTILSQEDLEVRSVTNRQANITTIEELVGSRTLRNFHRGQIISSTAVRRDPLVRPGMQVEVLYFNQKFKILAPGIVRKPGHLGDRVPVRVILGRKTSNHEVLGTVVGPGRIEVRTASSSTKEQHPR
ncbi:MAG: flagellar basal body P-ring formation chaperone FlgA [Planctomycetota bacterium]|jgi:flagella basal body P-ring formation protein FlgA|nr:flagellar basal body P-ring formation chaperone FlgA [Planctomycetota bacterium]